MKLSVKRKTPPSDLVLGTPPYSEITFIMFFVFLLEIKKKKQSNRINTDYDGFGNVLLAPYWLVGGFCFLGSFFVNCGVSVLVFFLLLCGFISRLNISFQHHVVSYVIIYFWSSLFSFISIQTQSVYIHFDFLCWYLAFFNQLIIIVLWSLTPKFPEIKKILFPNFFYVAHSWFCGVWAERCR